MGIQLLASSRWLVNRETVYQQCFSNTADNSAGILRETDQGNRRWKSFSNQRQLSMAFHIKRTLSCNSLFRLHAM